MSDPAQTIGQQRRSELAPHADQVCHAFEAAWKAGQRPAIERYLQDTPPSERTRLLLELLKLELAYRARHNETPTLEEYRERFPEEVDVIGSAFRDTPTGVALPQSSPMPGVSAGPPANHWPAIPGYEILDQLAPGGMGVVYRARQVALNRTVALKVISTGAHAGPQERARFRVEVEAIASLSHPHIIPIHDSGEWNGLPYLALEFAEGGSLAQQLASGPLPPAEAAAMVETLAQAMQFVHERGLIHRDLKPANVLLTRQGIPKLADFGLAKRLDQDQGLTESKAVLGTASYMAPEQATGDKHALGPATDVYALGAILYEILTGQPPFWAETRELTIHQLLSTEPLPPTRLRPEVPLELEAICLKCLEKEPEQRYPNARALAEDLHCFQSGEPISIQSFDGLTRHAHWARRAGYEILDILGANLLGLVYKAQHVLLKRTAALQLITFRRCEAPDRLALLQAEAMVLAKLHHPNLVEVYDCGECDGQPYLVSEYVEGGSLADAITGPPKPAEQTAALVETLARAVHHAHLAGIFHGGLKPSKVLLGVDGTYKITGFALAKFLRQHAKRALPDLSSYLAPEQVDNAAEAVGPATDVYALGAMLYALLTGRPPVLADTVHDTLEQVRHGNPALPRHWRPEVPHDLEAICLKCLQKEPAQRYPSAAALAEDLRRFRGGEVLFIDDLDEWAQQKRWARRAGYEILEVLGHGRDSISYKARQLALDRIVFLKRMTARNRFVPAAKAHFRREAHLLTRLRHPQFIQVFDHGEQNDLVYFAREFVDGPSLASYPYPLPGQDKGEARVRKAVEMIESLALAVEAAHAQGLLHGGLNPENVRLTPAGVAKITRFQRARLPGRDGDEARPESEVVRLAGYLAPEQLEERNRTFGPATDVYVLGIILYVLLTGQPPFLGSTLQATLAQVSSEAPVPPRHWLPMLAPELEAICLKCLAKQPSARPASARAVADELRRILTRSPD